MKKCPYCAEKIQEDAIVCRYCRRDLPHSSEKLQNEIKEILSPWKQGAKGSAVITLLYALTTPFTSTGPADLIGKLTIGLVATFIGWWLICTLIVWLWRKLGVGGFLLPVFATIIAGLLYGNAQTSNSIISFFSNPTSTPTRTPRPTHTPTQSVVFALQTLRASQSSDCLSWDKVNSSMVSKDVCVFGDVIFVDSSSEIATRIEFSNEPNTFFLLSSEYTFPDLRIGDCVQAQGVILTYEDVLYLNVRENLYRCNP